MTVVARELTTFTGTTHNARALARRLHVICQRHRQRGVFLRLDVDQREQQLYTGVETRNEIWGTVKQCSQQTN